MIQSNPISSIENPANPAVPAPEGAPPAPEGAAPTREGATPTREGATPTREGATPTREGATPTREGAAPASLANSAAFTTPAPDGAAPASLANSAAFTTPAPEGAAPASPANSAAFTTPAPDGAVPASPALDALRGPGFPKPPLSAEQIKVLRLLAEGESVAGAAKAVGVHRGTIHRWLTDQPAFCCRVQNRLQDARRSHRLALRAMTDVALQTLEEGIAKDPREAFRFLEKMRLFSRPPAQ